MEKYDNIFGLNIYGIEKIYEVYNSETDKNFQLNFHLSKNIDTTNNLIIVGDNLDALKILKKDYENKIKFIYIDPPYNTSNHDLIYHDHFKSKIEGLDIKKKNKEINLKLRHLSWIHFMYPRLLLARDLLAENGMIFINIDDHEFVSLKMICDEIFGETNFIANFCRRTNILGRKDAKLISTLQDYILLYAKNINNVAINKRTIKSDEYKFVDKHFNYRGKFAIDRLQQGSKRYSKKMDYPVIIEKGEIIEVFDGKEFKKIPAPERIESWPGGSPEDKRWTYTWSKERVYWGIKNDFIVFKKINDNWVVYKKVYEFVDKNNNKIIRQYPYVTFLDNFFNEKSVIEIKKLFGNNYFEYAKPLDLIKHLIRIGTNKDDIILDFFAGSGTTGQAVMEINEEDDGNRKFILVQKKEEIKQRHSAYLFCVTNNIEPYISNLTIERINRAGEIIKKRIESMNLKNGLFDDLNKKMPDIGYKVYDVI